MCWPLRCVCRLCCIFERCLDSNPEGCRSKQARLATHLPYLATHLPTQPLISLYLATHLPVQPPISLLSQQPPISLYVYFYIYIQICVYLQIYMENRQVYLSHISVALYSRLYLHSYTQWKYKYYIPFSPQTRAQLY